MDRRYLTVYNVDPARIYPNVVSIAEMKRRASTQLRPGAKRVKRAAPVQRTLVKSKTFTPELKAFDTFDVGVPIIPGTVSAGHVSLLNAPQLGTDRFNRIGRKIQIKKIHVRISLHPVTPVPTSVPEDIVFMLVWDRDGNTLPGLTALLQDTTIGGVVSSTVNSHQNLDESKRYRILKKHIVPLRVCGTATGALPCNGAAFQAENNDLNWEWNIKGDFLTQYNAGNAGTVADIANGGLILCWWTSLGAGLPVSSFDYCNRIRYFD
jgi:hypothetical protein